MSGCKVKVCGITSLEQALALDEMGVDYLGFIVEYDASPRSVSRDFVISLPELRAKKVAVLVDKDKEFCRSLQVDVLQLHGNESVEFCRCLRGKEIWKAFVGDFGSIAQYRPVVAKILVDAGKGSGKEIGEALLAEVDFDVLAGGLNPENLLGKIERLKPEIVDLNSGFELSAGVKDLVAVRRVLERLA